MTTLQSIARGCCFSPGLLLIRLLPASLSSAIRIPPRHPILASRRLCQNRWLSGASGKKPVYPPLDESVIREQFVSGSGPGGQKINKTQNKVVLTHLPSGTVVHCQETRSLHENRRIARERLQEKLDVLVNGDHAVSVVAARERRARDRHEHNRSVARLQLKLQLKADLKAEQKQLLAPAGRGGHEDSGGGRGDASGGSDAR